MGEDEDTRSASFFTRASAAGGYSAKYAANVFLFFIFLICKGAFCVFSRPGRGIAHVVLFTDIHDARD